jgi:hypothetical protein
MKISKETKTDENGKYSFIGLPEGAYEISLESSGGTLKETKVVPSISNGTIFELDFGLEIESVSKVVEWGLSILVRRRCFKSVFRVDYSVV